VNYHWNWRIFFEPAPNGTGTYLDMLLTGLVLTIETAICAWIIALVFGSLVGVLRTLPSKTAFRLGFAYVEFFRNLPLLVQLFIWFFVLPEIRTHRSTPRRSGSGCSCRRVWRNKPVPASIRCRAARNWPRPRSD
jgi:His/Glu/Gln/Arg/opine family amino acid ABC transporter permease subunit